uniref:Uncharacterized protein n=1 Tax=Tetranychus urticae TaxID=32264 RepID=T1JT10_TETUR
MDQDEFVSDTLKTYGSITFGKVPIEWIAGDPDQNDSCHSSICSSPFLRSIQSGLNDVSFPAEAMDDFSLVPENMSFTSLMESEGCGFVNLYTETAIKSEYVGILTSFQIIQLNVYILIGFLFTLGVYIHLAREKSLPWSFKGTIKRLIDGKFGFIILVICYFGVFYVSKLLSSSFTTNYSIQSRDEPLVYLDDLNKSTQSVAAIHNLYCAVKTTDDSFLSSHINTVDVEEGFSYIYGHLFDDRIVLFESITATKIYARIFCNFMINVKKNANFYIHKEFLQRAAYSCLEMGFCLDALDKAVTAVTERRVRYYKTCAQCKRYKQIESPPMAYHPIAFITIKDLLYLFVLLLILSSFVLIIELIRSYNRDKPVKEKKPFLHNSSDGGWHNNIIKVKTFLLRKRLTHDYPIYY